MNNTSATHTHGTALAQIDELERVRLELDLARWNLAIEALRSSISDEEAQQGLLRVEIDQRIGNLRRDVESLASIVQRLELRIQRLNVSHKPLSDTEMDDEEHDERAESATFWAEWRQKRDDRRPPPRNSRRPGSKKLLAIYRQLARLIHPDLATGDADRARREVVMRIANAARDAGDTEQLQRLIVLWSQPEQAVSQYDPASIAKRIEQREREHVDLQRDLKNLRDSDSGRLLRSSQQDRDRYLKREDEVLRRELANLRLRRRRLLRTLDERRRELTEASD